MKKTTIYLLCGVLLVAGVLLAACGKEPIIKFTDDQSEENADNGGTDANDVTGAQNDENVSGYTDDVTINAGGTTVGVADAGEPGVLVSEEFGFAIPYPAGYTVERTNIPETERDNYGLAEKYKLVKEGEPGKFFEVEVYSSEKYDPRGISVPMPNDTVNTWNEIVTDGGLKGYPHESGPMGLVADPHIIIPVPNSYVYLRSDFVTTGPYDEVPVPQSLIDFAKGLETF